MKLPEYIMHQCQCLMTWLSQCRCDDVSVWWHDRHDRHDPWYQCLIWYMMSVSDDMTVMVHDVNVWHDHLACTWCGLGGVVYVLASETLQHSTLHTPHYTLLPCSSLPLALAWGTHNSPGHQEHRIWYLVHHFVVNAKQYNGLQKIISTENISIISFLWKSNAFYCWNIWNFGLI